MQKNKLYTGSNDGAIRIWDASGVRDDVDDDDEEDDDDDQVAEDTPSPPATTRGGEGVSSAT